MITSPKDKSTLIGQMLMVGLQGTSPEDAKSFFNSLDGFPIGGVILYDQNMTSTPPSSHNILSPAVLDLVMNSSSFIAKKERCCSDNPYIVYEHAKVMIDCHLNYRVLTVGKHFPGQGSSGEDTHEEFVDVTDSWSEIELMPYRKLIENQSLNAVMSSHLFQRGLDPDHPATLSFNILNKLLRKELEFNGIIFSDDPQMSLKS